MHAEGSSLKLVDMVVRRTGRTGNVTGSNPASPIGFIVIPTASQRKLNQGRRCPKVHRDISAHI
nr:MAG TPA: hypothetical protein [Caudoviricetes sp.]